MRHRLTLALLAVLAAPARAQDGAEPVVASDLFRIQQLGDVAVSPDGRYAVYTVRSAFRENADAGETNARYGYRTHLWLAATDGSDAPRPLTRGPLSASQPAWHPDGDRIAFVRSIAAPGEPAARAQVFVLPLDGGEAWQLTRARHGVSAPRFSPDGTRLLFAATLTEADVRAADSTAAPGWASERPGGLRPGGLRPGGAPADPDGSLAEVRAWLDANAATGNPRVLDRLNAQDEADLQPNLSFRHLYVVNVPARADSVRDARPLTRGFRGVGGGEWMPDGRRVVVSRGPADVHPDRAETSALYRIDVETGRADELIALPGRTAGAPAVSARGDHLAFLTSDAADGYAQSELALLPLDAAGEAAGPARLVTDRFDRSAGAPRFSRDGRHVYFTAPTDGGFPLYRAATAGGDTTITDTTGVERVTPLERGVGSFDLTASGNTVVAVVTEWANPYELYRINPNTGAATRASEHNAAWIRAKRLSRAEPFALTRSDSLSGRPMTVGAWMMKPARVEPGQKYPLLLQIHGGPSAMWGPGEASMWHEFQFFAARGWGVVYSNPRGSGGYGYDFQRANRQDWGAGPSSDVLAAATHAAREAWVDTARQVVTGGSYAGYLTAWIVAHDHRFKAAAAQRGVYDLATFFGEGNAWRLVPDHFGGYPWQDSLVASRGDTLGVRALLARESPLTYVGNIRTPLLIKHGDADRRTGFVQSEMLYRSLKVLGREVELARYPGAGHELSRAGDPKQRLDRLLRIYEFLGRYVEDDYVE